jgi:hypothetical protein
VQQQKSIVQPGVPFGEIHIAQYVFALIFAAMFQNNGSTRASPNTG